MRKSILTIAAIVMVSLVSCKVKNEANPVEQDNHTDISLAYGCAYGDANEEQVGEQLFAFAIGDVHIDKKGEVSDNSNGYYLQLVLYADELTHDVLMKPGSFPTAKKAKVWTTRQGYDVDPDHPGFAYGGSILYKVEDGFFTEAVKMTSGTVLLEGSADNAKFTIDLKGSDNKDYKYKSSGAVKMVDSIPAPDAFYKGYERDSVQQVTINADYAELKCYDSYKMFTLWMSSKETPYCASLAGYYQSTGNKTVGTFPVGANPYDETPGTTAYSRGCRNGNLYTSFAGVTQDRKYYDYVNYSILFITGGTMTIDENDHVTATFTTFYGSTVNITFTGTFTR